MDELAVVTPIAVTSVRRRPHGSLPLLLLLLQGREFITRYQWCPHDVRR